MKSVLFYSLSRYRRFQSVSVDVSVHNQGLFVGNALQWHERFRLRSGNHPSDVLGERWLRCDMGSLLRRWNGAAQLRLLFFAPKTGKTNVTSAFPSNKAKLHLKQKKKSSINSQVSRDVLDINQHRILPHTQIVTIHQILHQHFIQLFYERVKIVYDDLKLSDVHVSQHLPWETSLRRWDLNADFVKGLMNELGDWA